VERNKRVQKLRDEHVLGPAGVVQRELQGGENNELMLLLRRQFPGAFHVDPYQHAFNAGQASVVEWLREQLKLQEDE